MANEKYVWTYGTTVRIVQAPTARQMFGIIIGLKADLANIPVRYKVAWEDDTGKMGTDWFFEHELYWLKSPDYNPAGRVHFPKIG